MKRREFLGLLGITVTWPLAVHAQQAGKVPRIGYLVLRASPSAEDEAFKQGLRELGWIEGQNIAIEYRWAAGQSGPPRRPWQRSWSACRWTCIVAAGTPVVQAAKAATQSIPIVMRRLPDPVRTGLVASLARPGGNITGMSRHVPELAGKRLDLLRDLLPASPAWPSWPMGVIPPTGSSSRKPRTPPSDSA